MSQELHEEQKKATPTTAQAPAFLTATLLTALFTWAILLACMDTFIYFYRLPPLLVIGMTFVPSIPLLLNIVTKRLMVMDLESLLFHQKLREDRHRSTQIMQQLQHLADRDTRLQERMEELRRLIEGGEMHDGQE